jgi:hypothetical protein
MRNQLTAARDVRTFVGGHHVQSDGFAVVLAHSHSVEVAKAELGRRLEVTPVMSLQTSQTLAKTIYTHEPTFTWPNAEASFHRRKACCGIFWPPRPLK